MHPPAFAFISLQRGDLDKRLLKPYMIRYDTIRYGTVQTFCSVLATEASRCRGHLPVSSSCLSPHRSWPSERSPQFVVCVSSQTTGLSCAAERARWLCSHLGGIGYKSPWMCIGRLVQSLVSVRSHVMSAACSGFQEQ